MTSELPLEPVLTPDGKIMWLHQQNNGIQLLEPGLWKCNKCGTTIRSMEGKPAKCNRTNQQCNSTFFSKLTDTINTQIWGLPIWEKFSEIDMVETYHQIVELIKKLMIFEKEIHYKIYCLWNISTWKLELWDNVAFLSFIGRPNSGKSRALSIITRLGYRAMKAAGVTYPAIPRLCHYHNVTLLVDEAHNKLNPRRSGGSEFLDFAKDSYKRGSTYITCDNDDQSKVIVTNNFGFKAFAGEKSFNPGFLSRSIIFWMEREEPEIAKLSYVKKELSSLQSRLLYYRFKCDNPPDLGNDFCLNGRTREIYESIISTAKHIGIEIDDIINHALEREKEESDELKDSIQYEILSIIRNYEGTDADKDDSGLSIPLKYLLSELNWESGLENEDQKALQKLGYIIKNLGLKRKRTSNGRAIPIFDESNMSRLEIFVTDFPSYDTGFTYFRELGSGGYPSIFLLYSLGGGTLL